MNARQTFTNLGLILMFLVPSSAFAANLISNPDFQNEATGTPATWSIGHLPEGASSSYPVEGPSGAGDKAVRVSFSSYTTGDAKWLPSSFSAEVGELYAFADMYRSTHSSQVFAMFTYPDASVQYVPLATIPSSNGVWSSTSHQFSIQASPTAPAGPVLVTVFHVLNGVGYLETDNYAVEKIGDTSSSVFDEGIISITFDDGWSSQYDIGLPILASSSLPASFYVMNESTQNASVDYFVTQIGNITSIENTNSIQWFEIYLDPSLHTYRFVDTYTAVGDTFVEFGYTSELGAPLTQTFGPFSGGTDKKVAINFTLPTLQSGTPLTIRHYSIDTMSVSAKSLYQYGLGYMTLEQLLNLHNAGHEIGGHTRNHCNLVSIFTDPNTASNPNVCAYPLPNSTPAFQIEQSDLQSQLGFSFTTFVYPNGAKNTEIKELVAAEGYQAARGLELGYNTKLVDKFNLKSQIIDASTTLPMIESWVNTALLNKTWLILVLHQISDPLTIISNGEDGGTTPQMFQDIANLLEGKNVKTVSQVLPLLQSEVLTPDLLPPVITLLGSTTMDTLVGSSFTEPGYMATDNVDPSVMVVVSGTVNTSATGTYQIMYNATDVAGNHALQKVRTVNVVSAPVVNQAPTIALLGSSPVTLTVGGTYTDAGATSTDLEDGDLTSQIVATGTVNTSIAGTYTMLYTVTDSGLLSASTTRTVIVNPVPVTPPSSGGGGGGGGSSYTYTTFAINGGAAEASSSQVSLSIYASGLPQMWISNDAAFSSGSWMPIQSPYPWTLSAGTGTKTVYARFGSASTTYATNQDSIILTTSTLPPQSTTTVASTSTGIVLGASTTCTDLLTKNMRFGMRGDDVKALQSFLNTTEGESLPVTGYFGAMTRAAVSRFQAKYAAQVLTPLGLKAPTGIVGPATRAFINTLACSSN